MNVNVNSIRILYRSGKITIDGVRNAMERGWITAEDFKKITGVDA
jgi:hypothetical protein